MVSMATETEQLVVSLKASVRDFERNFMRANKTANDNFSGIEKRAKQSANRLESTMAQAASRVGDVFKSFGAGFLGGIAAGGIAGIIGQFRQLAASVATIGDEAKRAGVSVKAFQEWKYVAEQNRIGVDALTDGLKEMNLRADEFVTTGGGSAAEAFARLGYSADDLKTKLKDPSALMLEIIGRLEKLDKAAQIRIADEIFGGTGGEQFVQLLDRGADSIRATIDEAHRLGIVLDEEMIAKADEVDRKFNMISRTVGTALKGAIISAVTELQDFIDRFQGFQAQRDESLDSDLARLGKERLDVERQILELQEKQRSGQGAGDGIFGTSFGESTIGEAKADLDRRMEAIAAEEQMILRVVEARRMAREAATSEPTQTLTPVTSTTPATLNAFEREIAKIRERTAALDAETQARRNAAGSFTEQESAAERARLTQELLNAAQQAGIEINSELRGQIDAVAGAWMTASDRARMLAEEQEKINSQQEYLSSKAEDIKNASKDMLKGFIGDLRSGKTLTEALINAMSRLADKLLDMALDGLLDSIFGSIGGGSRGNFFTDLFSGTRSASKASVSAPILQPVATAPVSPVERAPLPAIGQSTDVLSFLKSRAPNKDIGHLTGLQSDFQERLAAMMKDAPGNVTLFSGYRSIERQKQLWEKALVKYGSPEAASKWVAPPGSSFHNKGNAADLGFDGGSFKSMPPDVQQWLHSNAGKYGLKFPLGNEPWHIEPMETRGGAPWAGKLPSMKLPGVDPMTTGSIDALRQAQEQAAAIQQQIAAQRQLAEQMAATRQATLTMTPPLQGFGQAATQVAPNLSNVSQGLTSLLGPLTQAIPGLDQFGGAIQSLLQQLLSMPLGGGAGILSMFGFKDGGEVQAFAAGGRVSGPGTSRSDSIPAWLSDGEHVINADAARKNRPLLEAINAGRTPVLPKMNGGSGGAIRSTNNVTNTFAPTIPITVQASGNKETDAAMTKQLSQELDALLDTKMSEFMMGQMRPGNALNRRG